MVKKLVAKWLNKFLEKSEEDYRTANIAGVLEDEDKQLMKRFRAIVKRLNDKYNTD